jgi:hypothetical protein
MTINCEGMSTTPGVETEFSSHTKEVSKKRLNYGRDRGTSFS